MVRRCATGQSQRKTPCMGVGLDGSPSSVSRVIHLDWKTPWWPTPEDLAKLVPWGAYLAVEVVHAFAISVVVVASAQATR